MELTHASELTNAGQLNVLIVDENEFVHHLLQSSLLDIGINKVSVCTNAYKAISLCKKSYFHIVICSFNVKSDKDGFHLLEELKQQGSVSKRTILIFLSSETSESLVNSIIELQPDDFWSKPLNQVKVTERLKSTINVKQKLFGIYLAYDRKNYSKAVYTADRLLLDGSLKPYHLNILRLKGEAYLKLREFIEAESFYKRLLERCQHSWVYVGYVNALLSQNKIDQINDLLTTLVEKSDTRFATYDLLAQYYIDQAKYEQAYEQIKLACDLAPRNIERQRKLFELARLNGDFSGQYRASKNMVKFAKNSIHQSPLLEINMIRSSIDYANSLSDGQVTGLFADIERAILSLDDSYSDDEMVNQLLWITKARLYNAKGNEQKAQNIVDNHLSIRTSPNIEDNLDKVKVYQELGLKDEMQDLYDAIAKQSSQDSLSSLAVNKYIDQQVAHKSQQFSARKLNQMAIEYFKKGRLVSAIKCLEQAIDLSPKNEKFAISLLKVLIKVREKDQHEAHHIELADKTIEQLRISHLSDKDAETYIQLKNRWLVN